MQNRQALARETGAPRTTVGRPAPDYAPPSWDGTELRILDAAAALIAVHGIDGLTLTGIAKRAGVSRPTVYRRWPGTDEIVRAALLRTTVALLERLGPPPDSRSGLTRAVLRFGELFRGDPLYRSLLERQPEVFTRYSLQRIGSSQRIILQWLAASIERSQREGTTRPGDPGDLAVMLLLIAQSAILSHHTVSSLIGDAEFDAQLAHAVDGYLRP